MKKSEDVKILVVDDNQLSQEVLTHCLKLRGYATPQTADSGAEALVLIEKSLEENCFDIIFMDICMPEMSGLETIERIRQIPKYENTPIIAMSASGVRGYDKICLEAGANDFILIPTSINTYPEKIRKYCR